MANNVQLLKTKLIKKTSENDVLLNTGSLSSKLNQSNQNKFISKKFSLVNLRGLSINVQRKGYFDLLC